MAETTATETTTPPTQFAHGDGTPAKRKPFRREPRYGEEELAQLRDVIAHGTLFYAQGKKVYELERAFASRHGASHAVACTSGTTAVHIALMAAGISPGDEVITTPITDAGTVLPILWQGGVPVFADVDGGTYNLSPASVERRVTPRTKAVVAVHLAGVSCDLNALRQIADRQRLMLIEDCAQAHGCTYGGKAVGTIGHIGCYSYNEFKHISCGDGGIAITNDEKLATLMRLATDKGYSRAPGATQRGTNFLANNYRMTELQAAVALAQLGKLDSIVQRRRSWVGRLSAKLAGIPGLALPRVTESSDPSWWFYLMRVVPEVLGGSADEFAAALSAQGVPCTAHYIGQPLYRYPLFVEHSAFACGEHPFTAHDYSMTRCPVAEAVLDTCVMLAINESYDDQDLQETAVAIRRAAERLRTR